MDDKNEENKREDKESLEQNQGSIQRQTFNINLPDGSTFSSDTLDDEQYLIAVRMQFLQKELDDFTSQIQAFEMRKRHFLLEQKQLEDLMDSNGKPS